MREPPSLGTRDPRSGGNGSLTRLAPIPLAFASDSQEAIRPGALAAVNLGDDADTTGAIFGQLAGAYYGLSGIPERWRLRIALGERILALGEAILSLAGEWRRGGG